MQNGDRVRLDRWLWAARFFKTRSLAVEAIKQGRVVVNEHKAKPARQIGVGDELNIRKAQLRYRITVLGLSEKRLGAKLAKNLYQEGVESIRSRETLQQEIRANRRMLIDGKPSKKDRRVQQEVKRQFRHQT